MNTSYIKLKAKKSLVNNHFKCFLISVLPYVVIVSLIGMNYYLYVVLKDTDFSAIPHISSYARFLPPTLFTVSIFFSYLLWQFSRIVSEKFFYYKNKNTEVTLWWALKKLSFRQVITSAMVNIIKFFLSVAWGVLYLLPCAVVSATFLYYVKSDNISIKLLITLFVSMVVLFLIGTVFLYVTLQRYSMCNGVIFSTGEKDCLKVIEKSIELMEGKAITYAFYRLSFIGWIFSCLLLIPAIYVLPYVTISKYGFYNAITMKQQYKEKQKPIIFYIQKKIKA